MILNVPFVKQLITRPTSSANVVVHQRTRCDRPFTHLFVVGSWTAYKFSEERLLVR
jgi:hypothetical protein